MPDDAKPDTLNKFLVGVQGDRVVILNLPFAPGHGGTVSHGDALNLAAWLVALTPGGRAEFLKLLDAVENT